MDTIEERSENDLSFASAPHGSIGFLACNVSTPRPTSVRRTWWWSTRVRERPLLSFCCIPSTITRPPATSRWRFAWEDTTHNPRLVSLHLSHADSRLQIRNLKQVNDDKSDPRRRQVYSLEGWAWGGTCFHVQQRIKARSATVRFPVRPGAFDCRHSFLFAQSVFSFRLT